MNDASERRAAQRFEIFAQANVASGGDVYVMSVRNISAAGAFLEGDPESTRISPRASRSRSPCRRRRREWATTR